MRRALGQAARGCAWFIHHLVQFALALFILCIVLVGALAIRLSEGPLDVPWIAHRLEAAGTADGPTRLTIGRAELAWEGWRLGLDRPLDLRLADIAAVDPQGHVIARLPRAELAVSAGWLLLGRIIPRAVEIDGARLRVFRDADGKIDLDLGSLADAKEPTSAADPGDNTASDPAPPGGSGLSSILRDLSRPAQTDQESGQGAARPGNREALRSRWSQLRRVRIRNSAIVVVDHQLDVIWRAPQLDLDLRRRPQGGVEGTGHADVWIGGETLGLSLRATPQGDGGGGATTVQADLTPFVPARFARVSAILAPLAALDAQVTVSATAMLGGDLLPTGASVRAHVDAGRARVNQSVVAFLGADFSAEIGGGELSATLARLELAPRTDGPHTTITGSVKARRDGDHFGVGIDVGLDQVTFGDLPAIWPEGVGGPGTRPWIVKNITAGLIRDARFKVALAVATNFSDANVSAITGGFGAEDLTVHWLRPVPPIEHGEARLAFAGPDVIDITVLAGRQAGGAQGGLMLHGGRVHLTGIAGKDQFADIDAELAGPVADLLTLLRHPKIKLLDRRPIEMRNPAGKLAGKLSFAHLPLKDSVTMDDLQVRSTAHLTDVHLGGVAAGRDLDRGTLDIDASNDGMHVKGTATVATIPAQLAVDLDFRDGPPSQVLTKVAASGNVESKALAGLGVDPGGILTGTVGVQANVQQRRDGRGDVSVKVDLARAAIAQPRYGVNKALGVAANGELLLVLDHDRIASIDRVSLVGDGIVVQGAADMAAGRPNVLRLERVRLGATTDMHGEIGLPQKPGDAYRVDLQGTSIDVSGEFGRTSPRGAAKPASTPPATAQPGPAYLVDLKFDRVVVANGLSFTALTAHVDNDGRIIRRARIEGRAGLSGPFSIVIDPSSTGRRLEGSAADMGALLRGLDVADDITSGRMSVSGNYDDRHSGHPLSGRLDVSEFRIRNAPALGKILQGMTLYGLADAMSGPGLNFSRLVTPFRYTGDMLELMDARAFSSSLGMTAKGQLDLGRRVMALEGTVVPAYFFNSLLGDIPLVGRIFSPEQGGGLFAVTYSAKGSFDSPSVGINPLSALTPGFLRGIFSVFDDPKK